jgi:hypothetical protein
VPDRYKAGRPAGCYIIVYDLKQSYDRRFGAARPLRFGQVYRMRWIDHAAGRLDTLAAEIRP